MKFDSIESIKEYFGITSDNIDEIRKELKKLINENELHSDKTQDKFNSGLQRDILLSCTEALNFLKEQKKDLKLSETTLVDFEKRIETLEKYQEIEEYSKSQKLNENLNSTIQTSIIKFHKRHYNLKLTSIISGSVLTSLWAFPLIAKKNPAIQKIININETVYLFVWSGLLLLFALIWIFSKRTEKKDSVIKSEYKLDSNQSKIFRLFLAWIRIKLQVYDSYEYDEKKKETRYKFTTDDLFNFLLQHYNDFSLRFKDLKETRIFNISYEMRNYYESSNYKKSESLLKRFQRFLFGIPGELDIEFAKDLSDLMFKKLISRNLIQKDKNQIFSDIYTFIEKE